MNGSIICLFDIPKDLVSPEAQEVWYGFGYSRKTPRNQWANFPDNLHYFGYAHDLIDCNSPSLSLSAAIRVSNSGETLPGYSPGQTATVLGRSHRRNVQRSEDSENESDSRDWIAIERGYAPDKGSRRLRHPERNPPEIDARRRHNLVCAKLKVERSEVLRNSLSELPATRLPEYWRKCPKTQVRSIRRRNPRLSSPRRLVIGGAFSPPTEFGNPAKVGRKLADDF
nr:hypothetical protein Iba_chr15bCG10590 [Ipomoea batatas]